MHLMIADFGSSKILPADYDFEQAQEDIDRDRDDQTNEIDIESLAARRPLRRKASFVGTAQYVSPEVLKGNAIQLSADLWSLGCIIYQMIAGMPPFRAPSEYLIFQKILIGEYDFPDGFDTNAKDLIKKLLCFNPKDRLGATDPIDKRYQSIRNHPFFDGINWNEDLYRQTPPEMKLPQSFIEDQNKEKDFDFSDVTEPGLGERQLRRILQMEFGTLGSDTVQSTSSCET